MNTHHIITIVILFALLIFISCPTKTPVPDMQEREQAYKIEDIPLSENLVKHIKSEQKEKYIMYTYYTVGNKDKIHKQYWEGLIVFDDLPLPNQVLETTDGDGNKTVDWRENPLRKSHSKDIYNVNGVLYRRTTINPDGSAIDLVDVNGNGVVDYMEAFLPNGDSLIVATDPLGIDYLKEILEGTNNHCKNTELFRAMSKSMPGCRGSSGSGAGIGTGGASNPYDDLMARMCEGYQSSGRDRFNGATRGRVLVNRRIFPPVANIDEDGKSVVERQTETYSDGSVIKIAVYRNSTNEGFIDITTESIEERPDGTRITTTTSMTQFAGGGAATQHIVENCKTDGCVRTTTDTYISPDGVGSTEVFEQECDRNGNCSVPVPIDPPGSGTGHPGFDPDHSAAMAEFCEIWNQSQEDRPNDVSELNERANEERCNIEPDESGATEGSSLAETCYADIEARDELVELFAAGTCTTATGGAHFDYDSESPQRCRQNRFYILENWLLMNGPVGIVGIEGECRDNPACDPANVLRLE